MFRCIEVHRRPESCAGRRESGLAFRDTADIVASVADALHFGHQKGIIHRDVKPANILLDRAGKPFLVDYGLALQDRNLDDAFRCAGTPTYMSPEQCGAKGIASTVGRISSVLASCCMSCSSVGDRFVARQPPRSSRASRRSIPVHRGKRTTDSART